MEQSGKLRRRLLSSALLICSVATITGCGLGSGHTMGDLMGDTRTMPDGDQVDFNNRHTPILNPGNNPGSPVAPQSEDMSPPPAKAKGSSAPVVSGRTTPIENQAILAENAPTSLMAPVSPVTVSTTPAVPTIKTTAVSDDTAPVLSKPKTSAVASATDADTVPPPVLMGSDMDLSQPRPPSLASVPPIPVVPPKEQTTAQYNTLIQDQGQAEAARGQLMNNTDATVMTSPQTGQVVDNAATATPPAKPQSGFNGWLHNLFQKPASPSAVPSASATPTSPTFAQATPPAPMAAKPPTPLFDNSTVVTDALPATPPESAPKPVMIPDDTDSVHLTPPAVASFPVATLPVPPAPVAVAVPPPPPAPETIMPAQADMSDDTSVHLTPPAVASVPVATLPVPPAPVAVAVPPPPPPPAPKPIMPAQADMSDTDSVHLTPPPVMSISAATPPPPPTPVAVAAPPPPPPPPAPIPIMTPAEVRAGDATVPSHFIPPAPSAPPPVAAPSSTLPDVSQLAGQPDSSVTLTPPSQQDDGATQGRYLPDSRYAGRRNPNTDDSTY